MTLADTMGLEAYQAHVRQLAAARQRKRYRAHGNQKKWQPFIGIDGEGGGKDHLGRQHYKLMRAGNIATSEGELFDDGLPLRTADCLEFLLSLPANAILVGYFFTYDATQILRDLPPERLCWALNVTPHWLTPAQQAAWRLRRDAAVSGYVYWRGYAIEFRPKQYFRVARLDNREYGARVIKGTSRTVNECGGFFQKSFVEAIKDWNIGTAYGRDLIAENKAQRSSFDTIGLNERNYCRIEVKYLAKLMTAFREACFAADTMPGTWRGSGAIAAALHRSHGTPRRQSLTRAKRLDLMASCAYFGGRFEITRIGWIPGPVYEYDIRSAYPASMRRLPCPIHTRWRPFKGNPPQDAELFVADVTFRHNPAWHLGNLPIRTEGRLAWPLNARGHYWSPELIAANRAGTVIVACHGGYYAERKCECAPFDWVERLYAERKRLGSQTRGYPIKIGINSLYGKLAQRMGGAPYRDLIAAGLVTAMTRAMLVEAYATLPPEQRQAIVMMATDAIFSTRRLVELDIGEGLGQWEQVERPTGLFIVQPGIYWSPGSEKLPKTRGIPRSQIIGRRQAFELQWQDYQGYQALLGPDHDPPTYAVPVQTFIGHRLALHWRRPEAAGCWETAPRQISFAWKNKRQAAPLRLDGQSAWTAPLAGHPGLRSEVYDPTALTEMEQFDLETEAENDFQPWANSGE